MGEGSTRVDPGSFHSLGSVPTLYEWSGGPPRDHDALGSYQRPRDRRVAPSWGSERTGPVAPAMGLHRSGAHHDPVTAITSKPMMTRPEKLPAGR